MRRGRASSVLAVVTLVAALFASGLTTAAAAADGWSIDVSGEVEGSAKNVKPACLIAGGSLFARATFKVGSDRYALAMHFASAAPGPAPVTLSMHDLDDPTQAWMGAGDGAGAIGGDGRSGTAQGTLVGAQGNVDVDVTFDCGAKGTVGGSVPNGDDTTDDPPADSAPNFDGTVEGSTSVHCTGSETGEIHLFGFKKNKVFGGVVASGSYTCEGITVPTQGGILYSGTFKNGVLRVHVDEIIGLLSSVVVCQVDRTLEIRIRNGRGETNLSFTAPSGDIYDCTFTIEGGP